jgi:hypothetical protein
MIGDIFAPYRELNEKRLIELFLAYLKDSPPDYCLKHKAYFERGGECPICKDDH